MPAEFHHLRDLFNVSTEDYIASILGDPTKMQQNFSEGRSGSFFYYTEDMRYCKAVIAR